MAYLERQAERILDPARIRPGARSLLVLGLGHARPAIELQGGGRIARYAAGRDYHNLIGKLLKKLARRLEQEGFAGPYRGIVDAGPLLERSHAAEAGLGFESKAANLLRRGIGPWFFLAELLLGEELEPTPGPAPGSCGTCTACIDACPTGAIREPGLVDARACISYLTIEHAGAIPAEHRAALAGHVFGCDICSEVCPWGQAAPDLSARLGTHATVAEGTLAAWLTDAQLEERLVGSPLRRARREGLARNAALALAAHPSAAGREALLAALAGDPSPVVRESAAWALQRAHAADAGVTSALAHHRGGS